MITACPDPNNITTWQEGPHPTDFLYQISLKPFLVTSPSIAYVNHSSLGNLSIDSSSKALTSGNPPYLLDLNASIFLNLFVNYLCCNTNTTPMFSNVLECCLRQTPSRKLSQALNQLPTVHTRQVTQQLITHHANLVAPRKLNCASHTNEIYPIAAIREPTKKGYIRLTGTW